MRTSALIGFSTAIAGCSTKSTDSTGSSTPPSGDGTTTDGSDADQGEGQQTEADAEDAVRYFFDDQTGALGHLGDDNIPENYDNTITNSKTEEEYQEMQTNDRAYAEDAASSSTAPNGTGLDMTVDQMIDRAEEIYNNPTQHIEVSESHEDLDLLAEDDEIVFTRALIQATQEAGVDSSGLADDVVANIAEDAVQQIQPGFTNYKLSTLSATEPISPNSTGATGGGERTNEWS
ncbi:hypothetical protein [Halorientalis pallida]|uniref:Lipoprotein n=1 Tax=Halorientalis pallida TaxID=2479928 RepID=A0A498L978_9EURY|nr:hypothetical protein [Halorientalis pallida]RXK51713.1 hypothetical protein EAF64_03520 [Halorientalis pallida]